jgi:hypothetical protein
VARKFKVALRTVQHWLQRAGRRPLDRVDWTSASHAPERQARQTPPNVIELVVRWRSKLQHESPLGFCGAEAIAEQLRRLLPPARQPSVRTINRILRREGLLDGHHRFRHPPPPRGWYLPPLAQRQADMDCFDVIEGLALEGHGEIEVLTGKAFWGPYAHAWPTAAVSAQFVLQRLRQAWQQTGLPTYAQFDNDTRFQGPHNRPGVLGRVIRFCLALGVTPVFVPPRETGFQALAENLNNLWQRKVWDRSHHDHVPALLQTSNRFVTALCQRSARRLDQAPPRRPFPAHWRLDWQAPLRGSIVFLRRTDAAGAVRLLQLVFALDPLWPHRLLRCELDLDAHCVRFYRLRRREPYDQPLVKTMPFSLPERDFRP